MRTDTQQIEEIVQLYDSFEKQQVSNVHVMKPKRHTWKSQKAGNPGDDDIGVATVKAGQSGGGTQETFESSKDNEQKDSAGSERDSDKHPSIEKSNDQNAVSTSTTESVGANHYNGMFVAANELSTDAVETKNADIVLQRETQKSLISKLDELNGKLQQIQHSVGEDLQNEIKVTNDHLNDIKVQ